MRDVSSEQRVLQGYLTLGLRVFAGHAKRAEAAGNRNETATQFLGVETGVLVLNTEVTEAESTNSLAACKTLAGKRAPGYSEDNEYKLTSLLTIW